MDIKTRRHAILSASKSTNTQNEFWHEPSQDREVKGPLFTTDLYGDHFLSFYS